MASFLAVWGQQFLVLAKNISHFFSLAKCAVVIAQRVIAELEELIDNYTGVADYQRKLSQHRHGNL